MFTKFVFIISAILTVSGALLVPLTRNIVHSCIFLLFCLIGVAGLYVTLNAEFVAATQLVVYVGGVVVLLLFAIMLTGGTNLKSIVNRFGIEATPLMGNAKTFTLGTLSALVIFSIFAKFVFGFFSSSKNELGTTFFSVENIGVKLLTDHILAFEISSVLLLGALIGAAIISRPQKSTDLEN